MDEKIVTCTAPEQQSKTQPWTNQPS